VRSASGWRKYELECLRLAADCRQLAYDAPGSKWKSHFARMARVWQAHAGRSPEILTKTQQAIETRWVQLTDTGI
jgi:hypothetical protein